MIKGTFPAWISGESRSSSTRVTTDVIQRSRGEEGWHKDPKQRAPLRNRVSKNFLSSVNYFNPRFASSLSLPFLILFTNTALSLTFPLSYYLAPFTHPFIHPSFSLLSLNMVATRTIFSALTALTLAASSSAQLLEDILGINLDLGLLQDGGS